MSCGIVINYLLWILIFVKPYLIIVECVFWQLNTYCILLLQLFPHLRGEFQFGADHLIPRGGIGFYIWIIYFVPLWDKSNLFPFHDKSYNLFSRFPRSFDFFSHFLTFLFTSHHCHFIIFTENKNHFIFSLKIKIIYFFLKKQAPPLLDVKWSAP